MPGTLTKIDIVSAVQAENGYTLIKPTDIVDPPEADENLILRQWGVKDTVRLIPHCLLQVVHYPSGNFKIDTCFG